MSWRLSEHLELNAGVGVARRHRRSIFQLTARSIAATRAIRKASSRPFPRFQQPWGCYSGLCVTLSAVILQDLILLDVAKFAFVLFDDLDLIVLVVAAWDNACHVSTKLMCLPTNGFERHNSEPT
jgi:hypothetical protein